MKRYLFWLIVALLLTMGVVLYRWRPSRLDITPDAQQQIDKAKRR
jgi:hypothetical protein